jgi:hypothetical protein
MIKSVLDNLEEQERRRLQVAFEDGFCQIVELPLGKFVGVNVDGIKNIRVREQAGVWAYGDIIKPPG